MSATYHAKSGTTPNRAYFHFHPGERHPAFNGPVSRSPDRPQPVQREVPPSDVGDRLFDQRPVKSCDGRTYRCSELSTNNGEPWCDYYGARLKIDGNRHRRCAECKECRGR